MVVCLEQGADLHMAQLMPVPLTVSCFSKTQTGFTFLVPAHLGSVLFSSLAVFDPRVGHTMDVLSPFIPVLCPLTWVVPEKGPLNGCVCMCNWPTLQCCRWLTSLNTPYKLYLLT